MFYALFKYRTQIILVQNPTTVHQKFSAPLMLSENSFFYVSCGVFMPIVLFANSKFRRHSVDYMTMQRYIYKQDKKRARQILIERQTCARPVVKA